MKRISEQRVLCKIFRLQRKRRFLLDNLKQMIAALRPRRAWR
jgi:hypothetical protein